MFTTNLIFHHGKILLYENIIKPQWAEKTAVLTQNELIIFNSNFTEEKEDGKLKLMGVLSQYSLELGDWQVDIIKNGKKNSFKVNSEEDAAKWCQMITLAASWSNYEYFCEFQKLKPWVYLLKSAARGCSRLTIDLKNCNNFAITEFFRDNFVISEISLEKVDDEIGVLSQILLCFKPNQLKSLGLSSAGLSDSSLKAIGKILGTNNFLLVLDLSNNLLTSPSVTILLSIFTHTPFLQEINLSGNKISDEGLELLFPEIFSQIPLLKLFISNVSLTDASVNTIINLFRLKNIKLKYLDISKNEFNSVSLQTILKKYSKFVDKKRKKLRINITPFQIDEELVKYIDSESCVLKKCQNKKPMPKVIRHRETIGNISQKIDSIKENVYIEDLVEVINELSHLDFQFPRIRLEKLEKIAYEYLNIAISQPNYYCLELLVPALRKIGVFHQQAEEMISMLNPEVEHIINTLENVLSIELYTEENIPEINSLLDTALKRCDEICVRGEIVQVAKLLKSKRDEYSRKNKYN